MLKLVAAMGFALMMSACSTTPVAVSYKATGAVTPFPSSSGGVAVATFVDDRGEPPKWLGAIRGGFGNPLKVLETDETVAVMVQNAFAEGVRARGGASTNTARKYEVRGAIKKLDCSQYVRREAHGIIEVAVVDAKSGAERFKRTYSADLVDGSPMSLSTGIFASVDDLRRVAEQVLQQLVDKALDDPAFRHAIRS
jgi:hypothetical protein